MRLPSYRQSHLLRYHPYPRVTPSRQAIVNAMDEGLNNYEDFDDNPPNFCLPVLYGYDELEVALRLEAALGVMNEGAIPRRRITHLILDLAFLLQRQRFLRQTRRFMEVLGSHASS
ncbi:hypothetical protein SERLA73DRAFT_185788 [Serpula lacrymans var. lacrymans S7.3]|uniref:Uncharacterized protein n=2 Tax=Serpula lacrymans var. lacrymans TaxID=341189 RepID=F8Q6D8_SERL3|nr:hypothetical protein SERLA73DRAFT_185788 [Serpula lacrymans var. lacrymans S7.3]